MIAHDFSWYWKRAGYAAGIDNGNDFSYSDCVEWWADTIIRGESPYFENDWAAVKNIFCMAAEVIARDEESARAKLLNISCALDTYLVQIPLMTGMTSRV